MNASKLSHAELDEAEDLDAGNIDELASEVAAMSTKYGLSIIGGCCGTDNRHIEAMAKALK